MHNLLRAECDLSVKPGEDDQQPYTYVQNVLTRSTRCSRIRIRHCSRTRRSPVQPHLFGAESSFQRLSSTVVARPTRTSPSSSRASPA